VDWKVLVGAAKAGNKVMFKGVGGPFGSIAMM